MRLTVAFSGGRPRLSPQAARTAGAICTTVMISGFSIAANAFSVTLRSRSAPVGQWVMHWPQSTQSLSLMRRLWLTSTRVRLPVPDKSQTFTFCTLSQIWMQRMHLMHLLVSR